MHHREAKENNKYSTNTGQDMTILTQGRAAKGKKRTEKHEHDAEADHIKQSIKKNPDPRSRSTQIFELYPTDKSQITRHERQSTRRQESEKAGQECWNNK